jgi:ACS family hexuronate transporter-like MFS transporter
MTSQVQKQVGKYRWTICALLFAATTINYLDRQVLSLLQPTLSKEYHWTNTDYANITAIFQFVYAFALLFAGRIIDRIGTKKGYSWALIIWSLGAMLHALAIPMGEALVSFFGFVGLTLFPISVFGFLVSRSVLAIGEAGNFPAAIKATAEYVPKKHRP